MRDLMVDPLAVLWAVVAGAGSGFVTVMVRYGRAKGKWSERFVARKSIAAVIVGAVTAFVTATAANWSYATLEQWSQFVTTGGLAGWADDIANMVYWWWMRRSGRAKLVKDAAPAMELVEA